MIPILLFFACLQHNQSHPESNDTISSSSSESSNEGKTPPIDITIIQENAKILGTIGKLKDLEQRYPKGSIIEINYDRQYPNGCFEQMEPTHEIKGQLIVHRFEVKDHTSPETMCTMAVIPGGFLHVLKDLEIGHYSGQILMNDKLQLEYTFDVGK